MTDEQITRWASQVWGISNWNQIQIGRLKQFAQLVAAHEREAEKQIETQLKMADENQRIRAELKFNGIAEAEKQEPVAWINVQERKFEWNGPVLWETPTVVVLDKIPLYTHPPKPDLIELTKSAWQDGYDTAIREREQK